MCDCILGFMRVIVITLAVVTALVGLLTLVGGIMAKSNTFMEYAEVNNGFFWAGLIFGLVLMLFSAAGIYGVAKGKRCCIFLFCLILGIVTLVLIVLTIAIAVIKGSYMGIFGQDHCDTTLLQGMEDAYTQAAGLLCTDKCKCNYTQTAISGLAIDKNGPTSVVSCDGFDSDKYGLTATLMAGIEKTFDCSGICHKPKLVGGADSNLFYFSNINDHGGAATNETCEDKIQSFMEDQIGLVGKIIMWMMIVSIVSFIFIVILCCVGKQKGSDQWVDGEDQPLVSH